MPLLGHQRIEREDWRQEGPFFCFSASVDDAFIRLAVNLFVCSPSVLSSMHRSTNLLERISVGLPPILKVNIFLYSSVNTHIPMGSNEMVIFIKGQTKNVSGLFESRGDTKVSNTSHWPFTLMLISIKLPI